MAKVRTVHDTFYFVEDVMQMLGFSRSKSYKIIREMNAELRAKGYMAFEGRINKSYFEKRVGIGAGRN